MEIVSAIVSALSAGASIALKDLSGEVIKGAYAHVRDYLAGKLESLPSFESSPTDDAHKSALAAEIQELNLQNDSELLARTSELTERLLHIPPERVATLGIDIGKIRAAGNIVIKNLKSNVGGISVKNLDAGGDATLDGIEVEGPSKN